MQCNAALQQCVPGLYCWWPGGGGVVVWWCGGGVVTPGHGNLSFSPDSWSLAGRVLVLAVLGPIIAPHCALYTAPTSN